MHSPEAFRIEVQPDRDRVVVVPHGELDMATSPDLAAEIDGLVERGFHELVVDLRPTSFIDSTGLHVLLRESTRPDATISVLVGRTSVHRVFEIAGVRDILHLQPTP
jgi:anti-sigma B factor antagonist